MKLLNLERADDYEVRKWLIEDLQLTPNQVNRMIDREIVRFSPFYFYKPTKKEPVTFLWRMSIIPFIIYVTALFIFLPIKWIFTGKMGYGRNFLEKFHYKWLRKMNISV